MRHISDHDLERYYLGVVKDDAELADLEDHLFACPDCVARAEISDDYVNLIRWALVEGDWDLPKGASWPKPLPSRIVNVNQINQLASRELREWYWVKCPFPARERATRWSCL
jgi:hypothetical protein